VWNDLVLHGLHVYDEQVGGLGEFAEDQAVQGFSGGCDGYLHG